MIVVLVVGIVVALLVGFLVGTRLAASRRRARRATVQSADATLLGEARAELRATTERLTATERALDAAETQLRAASDAPDGTATDAAAETGTDAPGSEPAPGASPDVATATTDATTNDVATADAGTTTADAAPADAGSTTADAAATAGVGSEGRSDRILDAVWQLQRLEMAGQRRREAQLSTAVDETDGTIGLVHALHQEIERVREEIGTPGDLTSDLSVEPEAAVALLVQRSTHLMLDVLARQSQAFDLHLTGASGTLTVTMLCERFEGSVPDADRIAEAIAGAGGTLQVDSDDEDRLRARLNVPTSEPAAP